jgi:hypothetical protein
MNGDPSKHVLADNCNFQIPSSTARQEDSGVGPVSQQRHLSLQFEALDLIHRSLPGGTKSSES